VILHFVEPCHCDLIHSKLLILRHSNNIIKQMYVAVCTLQGVYSCIKLINRKLAIRIQCCMDNGNHYICTLLWLYYWSLSKWYSIPYQSSSVVSVSFYVDDAYRSLKAQRSRSLYNFVVNASVSYDMKFHLRSIYMQPITYPLRAYGLFIYVVLLIRHDFTIIIRSRMFRKNNRKKTFSLK